MLCRLQIPISVYKRLLKGEDIKAITSFNRDNKGEAYKIISEISGFDNFWFSMVVDDYDDDTLDWHCRMSSSEEPVDIIIDIPETETFVTAFYDFSDLIYFTMEEPDPETVERIIELFKAGKSNHGMRQAIFPVLRASYLVKKIEK